MLRISKCLFSAIWCAILLLAPCGAAAAATFTVLYSFEGGNDGNFPIGGLTSDGHGGVLGVTYKGGGNSCPDNGCGTVYDVTRQGVETVLYSFTPKHGQYPDALLDRQKNGRIYGTTYGGGANGFGTVFRLVNGREKVLHAFTGGADGANPSGGVLSDDAGNLYGTTYMGGAHNSWGTVFKIAPNGTETVLHSFEGPPNDGVYPNTTLLADNTGNLYGTTAYGGEGLEGTVFKLAPNGDETLLYSFSGYDVFPIGNLIADNQGNLYGITGGGGDNFGSVFKVAPNGTMTILHAFSGGNDGQYPTAGLVADGAGNLYGTTEFGGGTTCYDGEGCGTVYKVAPDGTETVLHAFSGSDGEYPQGVLFVDGKGKLYGTATQGGANGFGSVFVIQQ